MIINSQNILTPDTEEPKSLSPWIHYKESLTDQLERLKGSVDLEVLSQDWVATSWWDRLVLQINPQLILQREIMMRSQGVAYWYARTVIPYHCYTVNPKFFQRLEKESIRNLIFGSEEVQRIHFMSYPVDHQCIEFYWVKKYMVQLVKTLWVRYTEYSYQEIGSFYLMEILLPELEYVQE